MLTSLGDLDLDGSDVMFFDDSFRAIIEQNLDYIINSSKNDTGLSNYGQLSDGEAVACEGDFRKVCAHLNIPHHMTWVVMRVNGLLSHEEYTRDKRAILIPNFEIVYRLRLGASVSQNNI